MSLPVQSQIWMQIPLKCSRHAPWAEFSESLGKCQNPQTNPQVLLSSFCKSKIDDNTISSQQNDGTSSLHCGYHYASPQEYLYIIYFLLLFSILVLFLHYIVDKHNVVVGVITRKDISGNAHILCRSDVSTFLHSFWRFIHFCVHIIILGRSTLAHIKTDALKGREAETEAEDNLRASMFVCTCLPLSPFASVVAQIVWSLNNIHIFITCFVFLSVVHTADAEADVISAIGTLNSSSGEATPLLVQSGGATQQLRYLSSSSSGSSSDGVDSI